MLLRSEGYGAHGASGEYEREDKKCGNAKSTNPTRTIPTVDDCTMQTVSTPQAGSLWHLAVGQDGSTQGWWTLR